MRWKKVETPTCDLVANSVLPHTKGEVAIAFYRSAQDGVFNVCENCDAYIRAAKWLAERGEGSFPTRTTPRGAVVKLCVPQRAA